MTRIKMTNPRRVSQTNQERSQLFEGPKISNPRARRYATDSTAPITPTHQVHLGETR
jgi:hypothetical protein